MARQEGLIKLTGQMGGVSFYKTAEDGYLARTKGGVDADRIKNSPEFARTRENGAEFGRAGAATKLFRNVFRAQLANTSDSRVSSRLTREMVKVVQADATNVRGQRNVIDGEAELLQGFDFNIHGKLGRTFYAPYTPIVERGPGALSVYIPAFIPANMIAFPAGATHVKLIAAGAEIGFEDNQYMVNAAATAEIALGNQQQPSITLETLITPNSRHPLFLIFGVEFYQQVNGQFYSLKNGAYNALQLVTVNAPV